MTSYKKIFAYSSLGCVVAGVLCGAGLTYKNSKSFDENISKVVYRLSNDRYDAEYKVEKNSFFSKTGKVIFKTKNQEQKDLSVSFQANINPIECAGDFYIPQHELLADNINKYGIDKVHFDFGLTSSELMFNVKSKKEPIHYTMDGITFLTDSYTGLIELKNTDNISLNNLILNIGAKTAVVKFAYSTWEDTSFSMEDVTYSAPIETFMRKKGDFRAPVYSHLKVNHLEVIKSVVNKDKSQSHKVAQSFGDVQLYRRMQKDNMEANGLKFDVGNKMGSVVIEGVNTPVTRSDFDMIDLDGKYQIKLSGIAFDENTNLMTNGLMEIKAFEKKDKAYISDVVIKRGDATFNGVFSDIVVNKLIALNLINAPQKNTPAVSEGTQGKAPEIKIEEQQ